MRRISPLIVTLSFAAALLVPTMASADVTAFLGTTTTPSNRMVKGFSGGIGLLIVAFEVEYANTNENLVKAAPQL